VLQAWYRQRTAAALLHALDDRTLSDIGLHRSEIDSAVRLCAKRLTPAE
jgi:uncharacterized protein YjiS (DUF1127 family)